MTKRHFGRSASRKHVALITWSGLPQGAESEQLLLPHLAAGGVDAELVNWSDPASDYARFDLVVLRTCWDYHLRIADFTEWLRRTARLVPVLNAPKTVLWNHNKFYLQELEAQGIQIAPTVFVTGGGSVGSASVGSEDRAQILRWKKVVVKPAISATAHNTWLMEGAPFPADAELARTMQGAPFLIQQFIPEIETQGEFSFIYLDGAYSHTVLKRPAKGDFRVQKDFGGSAESCAPQPELLKQADQIAVSVPQVRGSLYCRIDAVEKAGKLVLMELELIEPELFLGLAEGAAERFAAAIIRRLTRATHIQPP
jgi:glutathione synthase/RimK-type ligase-like ATP-grasp enzyme